MSLRTRFAPSPTGFLHIGGVRTALFNWLLARHHGGQFLLRIDDTDQERHVEDAVRRILDGFRWIGLDWDEGPEVGGPFGPYFQSQRADQYRGATERLLALGPRLPRLQHRGRARRRQDRGRAREACLPVPSQAAIRRDAGVGSTAEGRPYALRFRGAAGPPARARRPDQGERRAKTDEIGDFVIVRPDGTPLYNFATVVDDAEMAITHVVRADEHLSNTFPQLLVFEALGVPLPQFAHVPYVAEPGLEVRNCRSGSGRSDSTTSSAKAISPRRCSTTWPASDGAIDDTQEIFSRAELIERFTLDRVNSSPASHDPDKLFWVEGEWMKTLSPGA